jgi:hypothetical protein
MEVPAEFAGPAQLFLPVVLCALRAALANRGRIDSCIERIA